MEYEDVRFYGNVELGDNVVIFPFTVIGKPPMSPSGTTVQQYKQRERRVKIGNNCIIGANVVIYGDVVIGDNVLVADGAMIRENVKIGDNSVIGMQTKIGPRTTVGSKTRIMDLCNICGDALIEDNVFVAQGVMMANDNSMGRDEKWKGGVGEHRGAVIKQWATIGMNSSLLPNITIGNDSIVAAGAIVTKNVEPFSMVRGEPAKFIRFLDENEKRQGED